MDENLKAKEKKRSKNAKNKPILTEEQIKKRKASRTKFAAASFVLLLAVGILGNWYYQNTDLSANIQPLIDSSGTKTLGEAQFVGASVEAEEKDENEYFSSARLERQKARDEALEKLQKVIDSQQENTKAKSEASKDIARISDNISAENKIETLVCSKGVDNCLAVISNDSEHVDIIVDCEELTDTLIMQIKDIAMQQIKCSFEDVSIIQSK
ncbi:MAG: SpoIIIAH-like family protein [Eubacterium sp.]|nr:SpoIIIAH-like family protein [Eubacterium sp.]